MAVTRPADAVVTEFEHEPRMVAVLRLPISITPMMKLVRGLEAVYGTGLVLGPGDRCIAVYLPEGSTHE